MKKIWIHISFQYPDEVEGTSTADLLDVEIPNRIYSGSLLWIKFSKNGPHWTDMRRKWLNTEFKVKCELSKNLLISFEEFHSSWFTLRPVIHLWSLWVTIGAKLIHITVCSGSRFDCQMWYSPTLTPFAEQTVPGFLMLPC